MRDFFQYHPPLNAGAGPRGVMAKMVRNIGGFLFAVAVAELFTLPAPPAHAQLTVPEDVEIVKPQRAAPPKMPETATSPQGQAAPPPAPAEKKSPAAVGGSVENQGRTVGVTEQTTNAESLPRLTLNGIGPIRIGMTIAEARATSIGPLVEQPSGGMPSCFYVMPSGMSKGLAFMVTNGQIARVDITSPIYASMSGARVGMTQDDLLALYPGRLKITKHTYDANGFYLTYTQRPGGPTVPNGV